jgi:hypothetical protein
MEETLQKSAREIKLTDDVSKNKDVSVKIGTVENRNSPSTIFINFSFWLNPKDDIKNEEQEYLKKLIRNSINQIHKNEVREFLKDNFYFLSDNIFIITIPDNLNYNYKKNYISFELYLHTLNIDSEKKYPLNKKRNTELYDEAVKICRLFSESEFLNSEKEFFISKTSR